MDYNATGKGLVDDHAAIMAAMTDGDRCGKDCPSTSIKGAIIYFPPGDYLISKPIMQYYFTVMVGHPTSRPRIIGSENFRGIALIDTNRYFEDGVPRKTWYGLLVFRLGWLYPYRIYD
jgi:hypothetical protein